MPKLDDSFVYRPKVGDDMLAWCINLFSYHNGDPFRPDAWQGFYLKSNNRFLIANKSRRIGWSYITAVKGLAEALDPAVNGYTKQFVSYSLEDATEKIRIATEFYDSIPQAQQPKKLVSRTRTHLEFLDRNGRSISRLISMPCRAPRGRGGSISLDEFAFHQKDEEIYTAALPIISRGGNLEIGSTPFGNKGKFYEIFVGKEKYDKYRRFNVPWYMSPALCRDVHAAIADTNLTTEQRVAKYGTEIVTDILKSLPIDDFEQEYQCSYRDELAAFITLSMIRACTPVGDDEIVPYRNLDDFILAYRPETHGSLYAGYDVGRTNDKSELTIVGHYPGENIRTVWGCISLKGARFEDQEKLLVRTIKELPIHRLAMDSTGLGMDLAERMTKKFSRKVEACTFTTEFKEAISNALWMAFDARSLILPADRDFQEQIHSIKKTTTAGKHARFDSERNAKHHCYDEKTEILTEMGWRLFQDLSDNDKVAVIHPSGEMQFEKPSERQVFDYDGEMVHVKNKQVDLLVTPNHRMYVREEKGGAYKFIPASSLIGSWKKWRFKKNAFWVGDNSPKVPIGNPEDFAMLLGWYLSEGCQGGHGRSIVFYQKENAVYKRMIAAIKRCKRKPQVSDTANGVRRIDFYSVPMCRWLGEKKSCYEKRIPREVFSWSKELLLIMFGAMMEGDGSMNRQWSYHTTSPGLADDICELLPRVGLSGSVVEAKMSGKGWNKRPLYRVNVNLFRNEPRINRRRLSSSLEHYSGKVYCVTTSTHTVYVRRNGIPCWSGNSDRYWSLALANYAVESGPSRTRGQFYAQWEQRRKDGTARVANPATVLNRIASNYQKKI